MDNFSLHILVHTGALIAGLAIGHVFGVLQDLAIKRNENLEKQGRLKSVWSVMPGSTGRVAALLVVLALIQVSCPAFFEGGVEWYVSGGVAAGYGAHLFLKLRRRLKALHS